MSCPVGHRYAVRCSSWCRRCSWSSTFLVVPTASTAFVKVSAMASCTRSIFVLRRSSVSFRSSLVAIFASMTPIRRSTLSMSSLVATCAISCENFASMNCLRPWNSSSLVIRASYYALHVPFVQRAIGVLSTSGTQLIAHSSLTRSHCNAANCCDRSARNAWACATSSATSVARLIRTAITWGGGTATSLLRWISRTSILTCPWRLNIRTKIDGLDRLTESRLNDILTSAAQNTKAEIDSAITEFKNVSESAAELLRALFEQIESRYLDTETIA